MQHKPMATTFLGKLGYNQLIILRTGVGRFASNMLKIGTPIRAFAYAVQYGPRSTVVEQRPILQSLCSLDNTTNQSLAQYLYGLSF